MQNISYIERAICEAILGAAKDRDFSVSLWDGEAWSVKRSRDFADVKAVIGATEESLLRFRDVDGEVVGMVVLYHGNDHELIGDYTDNAAIRGLVASADAVVNRVEVKHD